ncbi:MAG: hypothetical protein P8X63_04930 [Desulfuromonadaceae bacterium]|jgi:hypothetical protein
MLTADELLAGGALSFEVEIPAQLLQKEAADRDDRVRLRPLTVRDLQLISRAAKENDALTSALMVQNALVEPKLDLPQVNAMPVGLLQFLLEQVNVISGIAAPSRQLQAAAEDPLVRAAHLLSQEFGWTPEEVGQLTLGQILLHLQLLKEQKTAHG